MQGLADAFILMRYPFDSAEARKLNRQIFEHMYFAALEASCELAEAFGPYETYDGSPVSKGVGVVADVAPFYAYALGKYVTLQQDVFHGWP